MEEYGTELPKMVVMELKVTLFKYFKCKQITEV